MKKITKSNKSFVLQKGFYYYLAAFVFALIFTQLLRSVSSSLLMFFVICMPIISVAYIFIGKSAIDVYLASTKDTVTKNELLEYEIDLINRSIIPFPFLEAYINLPKEDSVRCEERVVLVGLAPSSSYKMKKDVSFQFRGTYDIGVSCVYISDFFGLFKVRIELGLYTPIYVLPRKLLSQYDKGFASSDNSVAAARNPYNYDRLEISNIRDYRLGDHMKTIHWKLSSKAQDLLVKEFDTGKTNSIYIFTDLTAHYPTEDSDNISVSDLSSDMVEESVENTANDDKLSKKAKSKKSSSKKIFTKKKKIIARSEAAIKKQQKREIEAKCNKVVGFADDKSAQKLLKSEYYTDMNEYVADGIIELSISAVNMELRAGNSVTLAWFDKRSESGIYAFNLSSPDDFDSIFRLFSSAPISFNGEKVVKLSSIINDTQAIRQIYVTGAVNSDIVSSFFGGGFSQESESSSSSSSSSTATELILYNPQHRFKNIKDRREYIDSCKSYLAQYGVLLSEGLLEVNK